ncbi:hypothetical protein MKX01_020463, partial [Papaver californicum]
SSLPLKIDNAYTGYKDHSLPPKWHHRSHSRCRNQYSLNCFSSLYEGTGYALHAVIPQNFSKFDDEIREGRLYSIDKLHLTSARAKFRPAYSEKRGLFVSATSIVGLENYPVLIVRNTFRFAEFESLESKLDNLLQMHLASLKPSPIFKL